jgi:carboxymethylenebutenolidase
MCDETTELENEGFLRKTADVSRRGFAVLGAGAVVACTSTGTADAQSLVESDVTITTPDGVTDAYFVHPAKGKHAAVIVWPDILGLRPGFRTMGRRLAESGYAVLVVNPFYRTAKAPVVPEGASFTDPDTRTKVLGFARTLNATTHMTDAKAFVAWLDQQAAVDTKRKIGTTGYCMGGPIVMRTAAAVPDRIGAGGSFHGGGLATANPDSPHLLIPQMKASFLIAVAQNDDERNPQEKETLRETFAANGREAEIEVYPAQHGWCAIDSQVYDQVQADRAHERLLVLFGKALA